MKKVLTIFALVGLIMAVTGHGTGGTAHRPDFHDLLTSYKDHLDGTSSSDPWVFEMWFDF